ncbi:VTT domain-containing protein [Streptomyces sp. B-S-A8]|uniref:VTT domain-containing protein n=1 Tax=Streptomyces solicavernae TaxID=3043614 RepID=A0ABT6RU86_9ACTN|nr:VTT domain-containing protein [Streptomyces sp. B-S-A8]MDI3388002.1 VTT domain-containing protein [Streptomyces sp. B-S-A8]
MADWLGPYVSFLQGLLDSPWLWPVIFGTAALDALLPFMPSEATVVAAAVLIGADPGRLALLTVVAAAGAAAGDLGGYAIGRRAGPRLTRLLLRGDRGRSRLAAAHWLVARHGALLIVAGRYVPGGRVVTGLSTGGVRYPVRRFLLFDTIGASIWAVLGVAVGALGGAAFADRPGYGLLLSFGTVAVLTLLGEGIRRQCRRRHVLRGQTDESVIIATPPACPLKTQL